jgi:hypothetical protein
MIEEADSAVGRRNLALDDSVEEQRKVARVLAAAPKNKADDDVSEI